MQTSFQFNCKKQRRLYLWVILRLCYDTLWTSCRDDYSLKIVYNNFYLHLLMIGKLGNKGHGFLEGRYFKTKEILQ